MAKTRKRLFTIYGKIYLLCRCGQPYFVFLVYCHLGLGSFFNGRKFSGWKLSQKQTFKTRFGRISSREEGDYRSLLSKRPINRKIVHVVYTKRGLKIFSAHVFTLRNEYEFGQTSHENKRIRAIFGSYYYSLIPNRGS